MKFEEDVTKRIKKEFFSVARSMGIEKKRAQKMYEALSTPKDDGEQFIDLVEFFIFKGY